MSIVSKLVTQRCALLTRGIQTLVLTTPLCTHSPRTSCRSTTPSRTSHRISALLLASAMFTASTPLEMSSCMSCSMLKRAPPESITKPPSHLASHPELLGKHQAYVKEQLKFSEDKPVFFVFHVRIHPSSSYSGLAYPGCRTSTLGSRSPRFVLEQASKL